MSRRSIIESFALFMASARFYHIAFFPDISKAVHEDGMETKVSG